MRRLGRFALLSCDRLPEGYFSEGLVPIMSRMSHGTDGNEMNAMLKFGQRV